MDLHAIPEARLRIEGDTWMQHAALSDLAPATHKAKRTDLRTLRDLHILFNHDIRANAYIRTYQGAPRDDRGGVDLSMRRSTRRQPRRYLREGELGLCGFNNRLSVNSDTRLGQHTARFRIGRPASIPCGIKVNDVSPASLFGAG
jgi:hypothetical protein